MLHFTILWVVKWIEPLDKMFLVNMQIQQQRRTSWCCYIVCCFQIITVKITVLFRSYLAQSLADVSKDQCWIWTWPKYIKSVEDVTRVPSGFINVVNNQVELRSAWMSGKCTDVVVWSDFRTRWFVFRKNSSGSCWTIRSVVATAVKFYNKARH